MEQKQRRFDWWMWTTLIAALFLFCLGAFAFNRIGGRGIAGLSIFLGFAASLSFFLRMYYRRSR